MNVCKYNALFNFKRTSTSWVNLSEYEIKGKFNNTREKGEEIKIVLEGNESISKVLEGQSLNTQ